MSKEINVLSRITNAKKQKIINIFIEVCKKLCIEEVVINKFLIDYCLNENEISLEYYKVFNKRDIFKGILRPELTRISHIENIENYNFNKFFYIANCFRNENKQRHRLHSFYQIGVEFINNSKNKIHNILLSFILIKKFIKILNINNYHIEISIKENEYTKDIKDIINQIFSINNIKYLDFSSKGNINEYDDIFFELYIDNIEVLGGGIYNIQINKQKISGSGFAIGLERLTYLVYKDLKEEILNYKKYKYLISKDKIFSIEKFKKIINLLDEENIDIEFSKKFISSKDIELI